MRLFYHYSYHNFMQLINVINSRKYLTAHKIVSHETMNTSESTIILVV